MTNRELLDKFFGFELDEGNLLTALSEQQQRWDLAGLLEEECPSPYNKALAQIDELVYRLIRARREITHLKVHEHQWSEETDYCTICGADGRA